MKFSKMAARGKLKLRRNNETNAVNLDLSFQREASCACRGKEDMASSSVFACFLKYIERRPQRRTESEVAKVAGREVFKYLINFFLSLILHDPILTLVSVFLH